MASRISRSVDEEDKERAPPAICPLRTDHRSVQNYSIYYQFISGSHWAAQIKHSDPNDLSSGVKTFNNNIRDTSTCPVASTFHAFMLVRPVPAGRCVPAVRTVSSYLVSEALLLLAAVSPAACAAAPAVTAGWTPLSSLTSAGNCTVKKHFIRRFTRITTKPTVSLASSHINSRRVTP